MKDCKHDKTIPDTTKVCRIVNEAQLDVRDIYLSSQHCKTKDRAYWLIRYVYSELSTLEDMMTDEIPRKKVNQILKERHGKMPGFNIQK